MRKRFARREDLGLTPAEFRVLQRLDTPHKIQAYLNGIPQNFEPDGQTALSVREVLRQRRSHCIEGGMLAAAALWVHGERPLLLDLSAENDYDHVVTNETGQVERTAEEIDRIIAAEHQREPRRRVRV